MSIKYEETAVKLINVGSVCEKRLQKTDNLELFLKAVGDVRAIAEQLGRSEKVLLMAKKVVGE